MMHWHTEHPKRLGLGKVVLSNCKPRFLMWDFTSLLSCSSHVEYVCSELSYTLPQFNSHNSKEGRGKKSFLSLGTYIQLTTVHLWVIILLIQMRNCIIQMIGDVLHSVKL
uniref:Uncharacterized protein n=1 Tax=Micrurus lemniscatus lemniscatus TaxID=129467 RepID=A0A2D4JHA0_MICLE